MSEPLCVNFRDLGADPQGGGYVVCASVAERNELSQQLKAAGLKVEWSE